MTQPRPKAGDAAICAPQKRAARQPGRAFLQGSGREALPERAIGQVTCVGITVSAFEPPACGGLHPANGIDHLTTVNKFRAIRVPKEGVIFIIVHRRFA